MAVITFHARLESLEGERASEAAASKQSSEEEQQKATPENKLSNRPFVR
jgi:hypothetical protein